MDAGPAAAAAERTLELRDNLGKHHNNSNGYIRGDIVVLVTKEFDERLELLTQLKGSLSCGKCKAVLAGEALADAALAGGEAALKGAKAVGEFAVDVLTAPPRNKHCCCCHHHHHY
eukprot:TRINITY_DN3015_c0_g1_i2.p2 TRINITY_DN3015_c0_g1~~TRINITY_DN3015_c0_g1_i2.p2  ORF type:complete len:116 (-),score=52.06 TRINITY_DN3015_c0_g1_i2:92-439(-)